MEVVKSVFKMIFGIVAVVLGIVALNTYSSFSGEKTDYRSYGGDAYTGMQNASADAANNALAVGNFLEEENNSNYSFVGTCFVAFGVAYFLYGAVLLPFSIKKEKK